MQEFITALLTAVITAAVPVITVYAVNALKKAGANAEADTEDIKVKGYINEITTAVADAVSATSQTYVDALKQAGKFTAEAQKEAAKKDPKRLYRLPHTGGHKVYRECIRRPQRIPFQQN